MSDGNNYSLLNTGKLPEKLYDDLLSPAMKKIGTALGVIIGSANSLLSPLELFNEKNKANLENSLKKYKKELDQVEDDKIIEVPTEIIYPILDRFKYVTNEQLNNAFVKLLTNASIDETASLAHPGFITIIDRLSSDEAKLLAFLKSQYIIPIIFAKSNSLNHTNSFIHKKRTGLELSVTLTFPQNIEVYLDNLESLGLIQNRTLFIENNNEMYISLKRTYSKDIEEFGKSLPEDYHLPEWQQECYVITSFCRLFMNACI